MDRETDAADSGRFKNRDQPLKMEIGLSFLIESFVKAENADR